MVLTLLAIRREHSCSTAGTLSISASCCLFTSLYLISHCIEQILKFYPDVWFPALQLRTERALRLICLRYTDMYVLHFVEFVTIGCLQIINPEILCSHTFQWAVSASAITLHFTTLIRLHVLLQLFARGVIERHLINYPVTSC